MQFFGGKNETGTVCASWKNKRKIGHTRPRSKNYVSIVDVPHPESERTLHVRLPVAPKFRRSKNGE
jgi:hypothetical protein